MRTVKVSFIGTSALWLAFLLGCGGLFGGRAWTPIRAGWKPGWRQGVAMLGLALFAGPLLTTPLYGLEYEDAFEYEYAARFLHAGGATDGPALNSVCLDGSLSACESSATLPHPEGVAVLASWFVPVFASFDAAVVPGLSLLAFIAVGLMLGVCPRGQQDQQVQGTIALTFLLSSPSVVATAATGFAEPIGALLLLVAVLLSHSLTAPTEETAASRRGVALGLLAVSSTLAVLCKRELGAALVGLVALHTALAIVDHRGSEKRRGRASWVCSAAIACGLVLALALSGLSAVDVDSASPAGRWPFSVANLARLGPAYLSFVVEAPVMALAFVFAGVGIAMRETRRLALIGAVPSAVLMGLLLLFDQDLATVEHGTIPSHHFARYTYQLLPPLCLAAATGAAGVARRAWAKRWSLVENLALGALLATCLVSGVRAFDLREATRGEEQRLRLEPLAQACERLNDGAVLVTYHPVVAGLVCSPERPLVDVTALGWEGLSARALLDRHGDAEVFLVELPDDRAWLARSYPAAQREVDLLALETADPDAGSAGHVLYRVAGLADAGASQPASSE